VTAAPAPDPEHTADLGEAALAGTDLAELEELPVAEHPAAYTRVHDRLQSALSSLDHL